jgi:hypothetical protein
MDSAGQLRTVHAVPAEAARQQSQVAEPRCHLPDLVVDDSVPADVLGIGYHDIDEADRAAVVALHPRPGFKQRILEAFVDGIRPKPQTTFGNVKADVLAHYVPGFERGDFVRTILDSPWAE